MLFGGALSIVLFTFLSSLVRNTETIWLESRALGLAAYFFLFASLAMGEWKILTKGKGEFSLFKYHKPVSIFAIVLVLAHFIAGVLDNYKWGAQLTFIQFLGFSFSDKWLAFLSLGSLAFYLMAIIGVSSIPTNIKCIGFCRWKRIHYLSYVAFLMAYVHSVNLGTDIKTSFLSPVLSPVMLVSFMVVLGLFIVRIINGATNILSDRLELMMAATFCILLMIFSSLFLANTIKIEERISALRPQVEMLSESWDLKQENIQTLNNETLALKNRITEVNHEQTP